MSGQFYRTERFLQYLRVYARRLSVLRHGLRVAKQPTAFPKPKVRWMLTLPFVTTVHCWSIPGLGSWGGKTQEDADSKKGQGQTGRGNPIVVEADRLYEEHQLKELYSFLIQHKDSNDAEILWRLARASRDMGKIAKDKQSMKDLYYQGLAYVSKALQLDDNNFAAHKWYAILLNYTGEMEGTKQKIQNAFQVKEHFLKAAELNPSDATTVHSLGFWYYSFADLKWYERKIANTLYGQLPTGTYQEALDYFLKAEEIEPNFYSMNLAMIGQTYMKLQDAKSAFTYLARAYHHPVKTADDKEAHALAERLLKMLGVKGTPQLEAFSKESEQMSK